MGVKGLWSLLNPVARPVQIESLEGKRLAIDSSIWLYQFQATMRDKDGRVLVNAHVLGFLRRINKLLFHGIKPVFVFDGGAPALKRSTIAERKRRKAGAALNHAKAAEKLLAAQMRREAVRVAQQHREQQVARGLAAANHRDDYEAGEQIAENATYLEDLEGRPGPSAPRPSQPVPVPIAPAQPPPDPAEERRKKFRKHDPYKLPETQMPTVSTEERPDARLATEDELQQFIDEMRPDDIDIESPEFRALPTEVQYEIIGDLRVRSRQQSHRRLAEMLRAAPTALDFSKAQIKHLSQRNALTQQLLTVTDMVGQAHLTIPVRIAAERNREYVLVKRGESEGGGWALGIREGSKANPIKVEDEKKSDDSDSESEDESESGSESEAKSEVEEVSLRPESPRPPVIDPDLREHRRREMLEAIARRYAPKTQERAPLDVPVKSFGNRRTAASAPLFEDQEPEEVVPTANDEALALALQQEELGSDEEEADADLAKALALSRREKERADAAALAAQAALEEEERQAEVIEVVDDEEVEEVPTTAPPSDSGESMDELEEVSLVPSTRSTPAPMTAEQTPEVESDDDDIVEVAPPPVIAPAPKPPPRASESASKPVSKPSSVASMTPQPPIARQASFTNAPARPSPLSRPAVRSPSIELVEPPAPAPSTPPHPLRKRLEDHLPDFQPETPPSKVRASNETNGAEMPEKLRSPHRRSAADLLAFVTEDEDSDAFTELRSDAGRSRSASAAGFAQEEDEDDDEEGEGDDSRSIEWSPSPSPRPAAARPELHGTESADTIPLEPDMDEDDGDMNREDMNAEEDDYARFLAQIKDRDLNEVRTEIDDEIRVLHNQNKVAMRDSDEITQAMVSQIQTLLRHFGIPYITAPMEAEAQCARLAELNLVDGIITDDSDVFLFGGKQCFKNIFNDAKYAECFLLQDINRELSLTRDRLISLAYFLGSDYTIGLPGVGPVVALEILANFPGDNGVWDFKEWWMKVQRGQDTEYETNTKWKKSFKKRFSSSIFLTTEWPNLLVREAYKYPETDNSEEPFHWGFPKLSALRAFLHEELSWSISKVDDELTPIVQRLARRGKTGALNKQGTLDPFFDMSVVSGNYAPRRRTTANVSKRLMAVIKQFREAEAAVRGEKVEGWGEMMQGVDEEDPKGRGGVSKAKGQAKRGVDEEGDGESQEVKKRKTRPRKDTMSSVGSGSEALEVDGLEDVEDGSESGASSRPGKSSRGRGRGGRRGRARWDKVVERPD